MSYKLADTARTCLTLTTNPIVDAWMLNCLRIYFSEFFLLILSVLCIPFPRKEHSDYGRMQLDYSLNIRGSDVTISVTKITNSFLLGHLRNGKHRFGSC